MAKIHKLFDTFEGHDYDTLIISDLHLGSELSRADDACRMLKGATFRRLILLGDMFCDLNLRRLKKQHWGLLSYIRKLSNPKRQVEVVWVEGNHDRGLSEVMSHLVGVRVYQEYSWKFANRSYLAIHGHQFDRFLVNNAAISAAGEFVYTHLQKIDSRRRSLSRFLDRQNTKWLRLSAKVAKGAIDLAKARGADVVFCGHTHRAMQSQRDGILYFNSGCWTTEDPTYITVNHSGVEIHYCDAQVTTSQVFADMQSDVSTLATHGAISN
ncbi:MAG TPA: UDP-2,3-diacylglucosamine diphosphatase [Terriglobia bacterium]|nr:UDP-2,3-diacylglucosamine diphosphatase [Terriglobia bacterium]